jgi:hypothetical protein
MPLSFPTPIFSMGLPNPVPIVERPLKGLDYKSSELNMPQGAMLDLKNLVVTPKGLYRIPGYDAFADGASWYPADNPTNLIAGFGSNGVQYPFLLGQNRLYLASWFGYGECIWTYLDGTADTNGTAVVGHSTLWKALGVRPGDVFTIAGGTYTISAVNSDTSITLATAAPVRSGVAYSIQRFLYAGNDYLVDACQVSDITLGNFLIAANPNNQIARIDPITASNEAVYPEYRSFPTVAILATITATTLYERAYCAETGTLWQCNALPSTWVDIGAVRPSSDGLAGMYLCDAIPNIPDNAGGTTWLRNGFTGADIVGGPSASAYAWDDQTPWDNNGLAVNGGIIQFTKTVSQGGILRINVDARNKNRRVLIKIPSAATINMNNDGTNVGTAVPANTWTIVNVLFDGTGSAYTDLENFPVGISYLAFDYVGDGSSTTLLADSSGLVNSATIARTPVPISTPRGNMALWQRQATTYALKSSPVPATIIALGAYIDMVSYAETPISTFKINGGSSGSGWTWYIPNATTIGIIAGRTGTSHQQQNITVSIDLTGHTVVCEWDVSTRVVYAYIDGNEVGHTPPFDASINLTATGICFGRGITDADGSYFDGIAGHMIAYTRRLTPAEHKGFALDLLPVPKTPLTTSTGVSNLTPTVVKQPSLGGFTAQAVGYFVNRVFAGNILEGNGSYARTRIRWSKATDITDFSDATAYIDLMAQCAAFTGAIRRIVPLGTMLVVYLDDAIFVGTPSNTPNLPVAFQQIPSGNVGLVGPRALASLVMPSGDSVSWGINTTGHFFVSSDNIYFLSSANLSLEPIGSRIVRESIRRCDYPARIQTSVDWQRKRVRFGFPRSTTKIENIFEYDWETKEWSYEPRNTYLIADLPISSMWNPITMQTATGVDMVTATGKYMALATGVSASFQKSHFVEYSGSLWASSTNENASNPDSTNPSISIDTPDYDEGAPGLVKFWRMLRLKLSWEPETIPAVPIVFTAQVSVDRGRTWRPIGTAAVLVGNDEATFNFRATGPHIRFRIQSTSAVTPYFISEITRLASIRAVQNSNRQQNAVH